METNNLVKTYASKAVQSALMRSVYTWMTLALVITGFVSMYVAKSYTLLSVIMQNSMAFWGLIIAELGLVWYLSARINKMSFTTATVLFIVYIEWCDIGIYILDLYHEFHCHYLLCYCRHIWGDGSFRICYEERSYSYRKFVYHGSYRYHYCFGSKYVSA